MAIPTTNTSTVLPLTESEASLLPTSSLQVGELTFEGRSYTVTIESSNSLVSSPLQDTKEKIQYLINLHLTHLKDQKGVDLSTIVIQQLDEEGLSYYTATETLEQKTLPSSEVSFSPSDPSHFSYSKDPFISKMSVILEVYKSIIDPLVKRGDDEEQREHTSSSTRTGERILFKETSPDETTNSSPAEASSTIETQSNNSENSQTSTKKVEGESDEVPDTIESSSEPESAGVFDRLRNLARFIPFIGKRTDSLDIVDPKKIIEEDQRLYLQQNPQAQKYIQKYSDSSFA